MVALLIVAFGFLAVIFVTGLVSLVFNVLFFAGAFVAFLRYDVR